MGVHSSIDRTIVYFHYNRRDVVDGYVGVVLRSLRSFCSTLVFVSNSAIPDSARSLLETLCDVVILRENVGLDVAAYAQALDVISETGLSADELILTNSTYFAPLAPWDYVFSATQSWGDVDFWGLTEHRAVTPHPFASASLLPAHIQSHWIAFRRTVLQSGHLHAFIKSLPPIRSYYDSVRWFESGLTPYLTSRGFRSRVLFPASRYDGNNPALEDALSLIDDGCPILKRRVLFHDPLELGSVAWRPRQIMNRLDPTMLSADAIFESICPEVAPSRLISRMGLTDVASLECCFPNAASVDSSPVAVIPALGRTVSPVELVSLPSTKSGSQARSSDETELAGLICVLVSNESLIRSLPDDAVLLVNSAHCGTESAGTELHERSRLLVSRSHRFAEFSTLGALIDGAYSMASSRYDASDPEVAFASRMLNLGSTVDVDGLAVSLGRVCLLRVAAALDLLDAVHTCDAFVSLHVVEQLASSILHRHGWHIRRVFDVTALLDEFDECAYLVRRVDSVFSSERALLLPYLRLTSKRGGGFARYVLMWLRLRAPRIYGGMRRIARWVREALAWFRARCS